MMFITEIEVLRTDGVKEIHAGPLISAESKKDAQMKALKMNTELKVVGKYISTIEVEDEFYY